MKSPDISLVRRTGLLCTVLFVLLCTLVPPVWAATDIAEITASMQPGTWRELPGTAVKAVFPSPEGHPAWGVEGPEAVVSSWSGAAYDTRHNRFIVIGGGHAAYGGNEVYEFWLEDLSWHRVTDPSLYEQDPRYADKEWSENFVRTLDGSPVSSHTYDGLQYLPALDKVFMFGGSQYRQGINYDHHAYLFDVATNTWTQGALAPHYSLEVATAWDSRRERVLVVYRTGVMAYDPATDTWSKVTDGWYYQGARVAAYDPEHDWLFLIGAASNKKPIAYVDLASNMLKAPALTGATDVPLWCPGLVYDPAIKQFVVWGGNREVWTIDPATWVATKFANLQGPAPSSKTADGKAKNHGIYSRWQYVPDYDVFIGYNSAHDNVWLYRLPPVPHDVENTAPAASLPAESRTRGADAGGQTGSAANMPSLPQPGLVVVAPGATQTSFPRPGELIMHPGSEAEAAASVSAVLEHENCGADLCVGPNYRLKLPSQAAKAAQEGDTVYIEAGNYTDCTVWPVSVSIRGIGGRPTIGGEVCDGKAVWITRGAKIAVENVELHGALGGVSNAAAIRHEGKALILRNVEIYDNHNGILAGHDPEMSVEVYDSVFHHMYTAGDLAHNIYVGKIDRLVVEGNHFYDGESGHFIKSLAAQTRIAYNRIIQKKDLNAAQIDLWGCQDFAVVGNAMMRTGRYGALAFIQLTYRSDGNGQVIPCPETRNPRGLVAYNTVFFNNDLHDDPRWSNLLHYNYPAPNVLVANNLVVHVADIVSDSQGFAEHGGRLIANEYIRAWDGAVFKDYSAGDLRPARELSGAEPIAFVPTRQIAYPVGTQARAATANVGAFEFGAGTETGGDAGTVEPPPVSPDVLEPGSYTLQPGVYELTVE